jgi:TonB family protein
VRIRCAPVRRKLIKIVRPTYPEEARRSRIEGTVSLTCVIGFDGSIETIEVEKGHELLVLAATRAISQWKYKPLLLNGTPVKTETTVNIIFQLPKEEADTGQPSALTCAAWYGNASGLRRPRSRLSSSHMLCNSGPYRIPVYLPHCLAVNRLVGAQLCSQ